MSDGSYLITKVTGVAWQPLKGIEKTQSSREEVNEGHSHESSIVFGRHVVTAWLQYEIREDSFFDG